jgi:pyridoxal 5'-phosphate synthase pdxS subunit
MNERYELNKNLAQMLKGGVIMDVTSPEQARIAENAGACAVMALERIPADIRAAGGVSRMSDPKMIKKTSMLYPFPSWQKCESGILLKLRFWKQLRLITLMKAKCFHGR